MSNKNNMPRCPNCGHRLKFSNLEFGRWVCKGSKGCNGVFVDEEIFLEKCQARKRDENG